MITNTFLGGLIGGAIAFVVGAVVMVLSKDWWIQRAHKLAAQSDIALPRPLVGRVTIRPLSPHKAFRILPDDL